MASWPIMAISLGWAVTMIGVVAEPMRAIEIAFSIDVGSNHNAHQYVPPYTQDWPDEGAKILECRDLIVGGSTRERGPLRTDKEAKRINYRHQGVGQAP